jgi:hypothetical protein
VAAAFAEGDALGEEAATGPGEGVATFGDEEVGAAMGPGAGVAVGAGAGVFAAVGPSAAYHSFTP